MPYSIMEIEKSRMPLKQRLEEALKHCEDNGQDKNSLWPYQPFSLTIGEILRAAIRGEGYD